MKTKHRNGKPDWLKKHERHEAIIKYGWIFLFGITYLTIGLFVAKFIYDILL
jgi:hypothetical protein